MLRPVLSLVFAVSSALVAQAEDTIGDIQANFPSKPQAYDNGVISGVVNLDPGRSVVNLTVSLAAGSASSSEINVIDVISCATNSSVPNTTKYNLVYTFPKSLRSGTYYFLFNATTESSPGMDKNSTIGKSSDFNLTAAGSECGSTPANLSPWVNITSPSDPKYTSIFLHTPTAGDLLSLDNQGKLLALNPYWAYRDARNDKGAGINNFTVEVVQNSGNGTYKSFTSLPNPPANDLADPKLLFKPNATFLPGGYELRINYTNSVQDGAIPPGQLVTYISPTFFFIGNHSTCDGVPGPGNITSSTNVLEVSWAPCVFSFIFFYFSIFI